VAAIASEGAEIVRAPGTYDDAVRLAADDARTTGGLVVSDTSYPGYDRVPHDIMLGYTRVMDEAEAAWADAGPPDVMFVQAGVGGLLAAVASWSAWRFGDVRPRLIAVEPERAACVQASARAGRPTPVEAPLTTIMAGLRCGEISPVTYPVIRDLVDGFLAVEDTWTRKAMRVLARPLGADPPLAVGTSGAAGIAALLALAGCAELREVAGEFGLGPASRVLVIATEGVTEPDLWHEVTGVAPPRPSV
jgi:diaminopropionate ammonia-lyase